VSKTHTIAVVPGDGIGPEVVREGLRVLERVASMEGFGVKLSRYPFGAEHYLATKEVLPDSAFEEIKGHEAILLGAIGDPRIAVGYLEFGIIARMRFGLDLYVNLRPVKLYAEHLCPLKDKGPDDVDFVVIRENTEDAYAGMYGYFKKGHARRNRDAGDPVHAQGHRTCDPLRVRSGAAAWQGQEADAGGQGERGPRDGSVDSHVRRGRPRVSRHLARTCLH
jgi:isocitrate/isopropylmalate dehydrogenase